MIGRLTNNILALYGPNAASRLVTLYRQAGGPWRYLRKYWSTQRFDSYAPDNSKQYAPLRALLTTLITGQMLIGVALAWSGYDGDRLIGLLWGTAIALAAPVVAAHVLFVLSSVWRLAQPKKYGKVFLCEMLEKQVVELRQRNDFTLIAVAGSVGKTSTKLAIAQTLKASGKRVQYQEGNYNDRLTVPLVLFGETQPSLYNPYAWAKILLRNQRRLRQAYPYDVAVVELGIDGPGQMADFAYLRPQLSVVTAVSEEHMEYLKTLDAVAEEELGVFEFSSQVLVNTDDIAKKYLARDSYAAYGLKGRDYKLEIVGKPSLSGQKLVLSLDKDELTVTSQFLGEHGAKVVLAAAAIGHMLEIDKVTLRQSLESLKPFAGRLQILPGAKNTVLLDDTYNASPIAVKAALDVLYSFTAPQRIAILGNMNEMGDHSAALHTQVGEYCDPTKLDLVVTIGKDAKDYLAPAAEKAGCTVKTFTNPHRAGRYVESQLKPAAVVLAKGSQNGVFAEEALKHLLANKSDTEKLVRQSKHWRHVKRSQFGA